MKVSADAVRAGVRALPALPRVVHDLRAALADDAVTTERVVDLVGSEPALAAATLRLANSSFYGASGRIAGLGDAVRLLGLAAIGDVVLSAAVFGAFRGVHCRGLDLEATQRHAMATATAAQAIAVERGLDGSLAHVAGLLHDIGRLALAAVCPVALADVIAEVAARDALPVEVERERLGLDHAAAGALLAEHWKLPPAVVATIARHHDTDRAGTGALDDVVHLADAMTYALGHSGLADEPVPPVAPDACDRLGVAPAELDALFGRVAGRLQRTLGAAVA